VVPTEAELERVLARAHAAGLETEEVAGSALVRDPFGNGVLLRTR
jgi:hypothetical protein